MIQQVAAVHLGWGQAPSLDKIMTYESTLWVPLDEYPAEVTRLYLSGWPKLKCVRTRENVCFISICRPADFQIEAQT